MRSHSLLRTGNVNHNNFRFTFITHFPPFNLVSFGKVINKPKQNDVKKGATHYESFSIDGHEYKIGDHVKLDPSDDDDDDTDDLEKEFWYALIVDIYYIRDEETTPENCKKNQKRTNHNTTF